MLEKALESPLDARRSNQSILKEISPEYSLEELMLKLKLQCFGHLMQKLTPWKNPWCWERLKAGGEGDDREWDGWMASPTQWTWVWASSRVGDGQGSLTCCSPWGCKESDMTEQLNWLTDALSHILGHVHATFSLQNVPNSVCELTHTSFFHSINSSLRRFVWLPEVDQRSLVQTFLPLYFFFHS